MSRMLTALKRLAETPQTARPAVEPFSEDELAEIERWTLHANPASGDPDRRPEESDHADGQELNLAGDDPVPEVSSQPVADPVESEADALESLSGETLLNQFAGEEASADDLTAAAQGTTDVAESQVSAANVGEMPSDNRPSDDASVDTETPLPPESWSRPIDEAAELPPQPDAELNTSPDDASAHELLLASTLEVVSDAEQAILLGSGLVDGERGDVRSIERETHAREQHADDAAVQPEDVNVESPEEVDPLAHDDGFRLNDDESAEAETEAAAFDVVSETLVADVEAIDDPIDACDESLAGREEEQTVNESAASPTSIDALVQDPWVETAVDEVEDPPPVELAAGEEDSASAATSTDNRTEEAPPEAQAASLSVGELWSGGNQGNEVGVEFQDLRDTMVVQTPGSTARAVALLTLDDWSGRTMALAELARAFLGTEQNQVLLINSTAKSEAWQTELEATPAPSPLSPGESIDRCVSSTGTPGLDYLANLEIATSAGSEEASSVDPLFIARCKQFYPSILLDADVSDDAVCTSVLRQCDAAYLMIRLGHTNRQIAAAATARLRQNNVPLRGCIVVGAI